MEIQKYNNQNKNLLEKLSSKFDLAEEEINKLEGKSMKSGVQSKNERKEDEKD